MTFDQAQSPRLGQRTSVESTYVQIFDVDPSTPTADLVEAAWPGMLIYRQDRSILQIFDGIAGAWADVAGGVAGQLTYVGDEMPTEGPFSIGDVYYDSDDGMKIYVWDGTAWVPSTAEGITTYYENGYRLIDPEDPDSGYILVTPGDPTSLPQWFPLEGDFSIGDLWYQLDDNNHIYRWDGVQWFDIKDPDIEQVPVNNEAIQLLDKQVKEAAYVAVSANNTADTADGRVSMSDYLPGADDITYLQTQVRTDPETGEIVETQVEIPRQNGSIWYVRTRPRRNYCTNPSFETNTTGWNPGGCTIARVAALGVPAGLWTCEVTNSNVVEEHNLAWSTTPRPSCVVGQVYTASIFAELISGSGRDVFIRIRWWGGSGVLEETDGDPYQLIDHAWDPAVAGTITEPRIWVTGIAPEGALTFDAMVVSPEGNEEDVWHTGAMLLEQEDDLGRYFDGDSYDGHWDDTPHASSSYLEGDKIIQLWELRDNSWVRKYQTGETLSFVNAEKLIGILNGELLGENTVYPNTSRTIAAVASEALSQGDVVNVWNDAGVFKVRKASATSRYEAHGFVWHSYGVGAQANVYHVGYNPFQSNLAPGNQWLGVSGGVTNQPPSAAGSLVQRIGFAPAETVLDFAPGPAIRIV